jgi:hypothetical protein
MRAAMDYFAHGTGTTDVLAKLAATEPSLLACMHGASFRGNGAEMIGELSAALRG